MFLSVTSRMVVTFFMTPLSSIPDMYAYFLFGYLKTKCIFFLPKPVFPFSLKVAVITQAPNQQIILTSPTPSYLYPVFIQSCGFCLLVGLIYLLDCWNNFPAGTSSLHLASPHSTIHTQFPSLLWAEGCVFLLTADTLMSLFPPNPFIFLLWLSTHLE